jgi:hypothetical protein
MAKQYLDVHLDYFKQGDDLNHCLSQAANPQEALKMHADAMRSVAEHLDKIAAMVEGQSIEIDADTHHIGLACEEELAKKLIEAELADRVDYDEDVEEDVEEDSDENEDTVG